MIGQITEGMKTYRYKNRYVVKSDDDFKFDLTSVKVGKGQSFKKSNGLMISNI